MRSFNIVTNHCKNEEYVTDVTCLHDYPDEWKMVEHDGCTTLDNLVGHPVDVPDNIVPETWTTWERVCPGCGSKQIAYVKPANGKNIKIGKVFYVKPEISMDDTSEKSAIDIANCYCMD